MECFGMMLYCVICLLHGVLSIVSALTVHVREVLSNWHSMNSSTYMLHILYSSLQCITVLFFSSLLLMCLGLKALILNNNELNQLPKLDRLIHLNTLGMWL